MTSVSFPVENAVSSARARESLRSASLSTLHRTIAAIVAAGAGGIIGIAAWLTPSETGLGTHQQLHLPPCGWITLANMPCPTCGMTTAFAHAAHGHLLASFLAQPMGCVLAIATAMALLMGLYVALTGSRVASSLLRLLNRRMAWTIAAMVVVAWGYKVFAYKGWI